MFKYLFIILFHINLFNKYILINYGGFILLLDQLRQISQILFHYNFSRIKKPENKLFCNIKKNKIIEIYT